jgi:hypothetical protein
VITRASRAWSDDNGNYNPDCDLKNFSTNGECGPIDNAFFGQNDPNAIQFSDAALSKNREYTWDALVEVQHEVMQGLSVTLGYNRNWTRNRFLLVDNLAVGPADYDPYCVTAPVDARLPGGGGYQICGLYDIKPEKFGIGRVLIRPDSEFGSGILRVWNGFTLGVNGRLPRGISLGGGLDVGKQVDNHCATVDIPNQPSGSSEGGGFAALRGGPFCRVVDPWSGTLDLRVRGSVPLPGRVTVSGIYQNIPGVPINADAVFTNAQIAPSLGRNLAGGVRSVVVPLYPINSNGYGERFTQLDLRVTRSVDVGVGRLDASLDLYNALNSNSIQSQIDRYGARWQRPNVILNGRLLQLTAQLFF